MFYIGIIFAIMAAAYLTMACRPRGEEADVRFAQLLVAVCLACLAYWNLH